MSVVAFLGMTHLGLVSAAAAAAKGVKVIAFDRDSALVDRLSKGDLPVLEPALPELIQSAAPSLEFTADASRLREAAIAYVAPDVPTDNEGKSDLSGVQRLLDMALGHAAAGAIIVVLSQVPPGFTRRHAPVGRSIFYQVETLIFGRAVERAMQPERIIVGCAEPAKALPEAYVDFLSLFGCPVLPMRYESAELAKISINFCLVGSISVANTLAELCEAIGADWSEIVPALRLDRRIGAYAYLSPGLGLAGGNLERDLATVRRLAEEKATDARVVDAWVENSAHRREWAFRTLQREVLAVKPNAVIGVLGLAYKENTHSTKNSPALALLAHNELKGARVYDPIVDSAVVEGATGAATPLEAAQGADALAVMTPWPEFKALDPGMLARVMSGRVIIDPYAVFAGEAVAKAGLRHFVLGRG